MKLWASVSLRDKYWAFILKSEKGKGFLSTWSFSFLMGLRPASAGSAKSGLGQAFHCQKPCSWQHRTPLLLPLGEKALCSSRNGTMAWVWWVLLDARVASCNCVCGEKCPKISPFASHLCLSRAVLWPVWHLQDSTVWVNESLQS